MIDLAIIGGGPGGYVAAERAGAKGLNVVLFEKRELGGVCLNEGCIPTKTLLYSAKVYDYAVHGDKYGISAPGATFDFGKIVDRKNKVVKKLVGGVGSKMKAHKVRVVKGEAKIKGRSANGIEIECNGETYYAVNLLLCTGSEAFVPPIPGVKEAGDVIVTNREILDLKEQPKLLVIIGGGVIGMEFASFFNSLGTEVTVVEMLPKILGGLDGEISSMLQDIYAKKGIKFNLNCKVTEIRGNEVVYVDKDGKTLSAKGDKILMSVGRRAVTAGIGHGGIEAMTVSAASMALYLVFALCWNAGDTDALLKLAGSAETAQTVAASLGKYTVGYCLLACLERVSAMLLHISLSVFVFAAARSRAKRGYLAFAIGLHAIFDMPAALYQFGYVKQLFPVELWLAVCTLYALRSARKCYLEECDA